MKFIYKNDYFKMEHNKDLYMKAFLNNAILRESCYHCHFKKINRISDITLADFWGIEKVLPKMDDNKGTSLMILNSEKGRELFSLIKDNCKYEKCDLNDAIEYNSSMIESANENHNRESFLENLDTIDFDKLVKKYITKRNIIKRVINKIFK